MTKTLERINTAATVAAVLGLICTLLAAVQLAFWGLDREPPSKVLTYSVENSHPGEVAEVSMIVKRTHDRRCSVTYARSITDSSGVRFNLTNRSQVVHELELDGIGERTPESAVAYVALPATVSYGLGRVVTSLEYVCNPTHRLYPILVTLEFDVMVSKPDKTKERVER